jgi:hypothetical protein
MLREQTKIFASKTYVPHGQSENRDRIPEVRDHNSARQQSCSIKVKGLSFSIGTWTAFFRSPVREIGFH